MLNDEPAAPLDRLFHALSDPGRRAMLDRLGEGEASVTELAKPLRMSLPAVVQHLQVLEQSGLIRSEKTGRVRTCRLEPAGLRTVEQWVATRRAAWDHNLDRLGEFLASLEVAKKGGKP